MVQPTKPDEVELYRRCRETAKEKSNVMVLPSEMRDLINDLQIPEGRAAYILDKWERKGWWTLSSCPPGGWFEPAAPEHIGAPAT